MTKDLEGKVALVTGGSRGIGAAIARKLADKGANIAVSYVASADKAEALVKELEKKGVKAVSFKADQADSLQVKKLVEDVAQHFGKLDILVNNAGVSVHGVVGDPERNEVEHARQFAINVGAVAAATHAAAPILTDGGRVISISSVLAESSPFGGASDYSATKAAVAAYTRGWARDLGARNITVNAVLPGLTNTDMNPDNTEFAETMKKTTSLGRYAKPEEIAAAVAFLASPEASYITGVSLPVDGGF